MEVEKFGRDLKPYTKRTDYFVRVKKVEPGTKVYNKLENANYTTNAKKCYVITGTVGEQWPVDENKLLRTYEVTDGDFEAMGNGTEIEVYPRENSSVIFVEICKEPTTVDTSWGDTLEAHPGDAIAYAEKDGEPDFNDSWVINKDIFRTTYRRV